MTLKEVNQSFVIGISKVVVGRHRKGTNPKGTLMVPLRYVDKTGNQVTNGLHKIQMKSAQLGDVMTAAKQAADFINDQIIKGVVSRKVYKDGKTIDEAVEIVGFYNG